MAKKLKSAERDLMSKFRLSLIITRTLNVEGSIFTKSPSLSGLQQRVSVSSVYDIVFAKLSHHMKLQLLQFSH